MDFRLRTGAAARFLGTRRQHVTDRCGREEITSIRPGSHRRIAPSELIKFASGSAEPHDTRVLRRHQPFITTLPINSPAVTAEARPYLTRAGNEYPQDWARTLESGLGMIDVQTPRPQSAALRARSPFTEFLPRRPNARPSPATPEPPTARGITCRADNRPHYCLA